MPSVGRVSKERVTMSVKSIPDGYHTITPYLLVGGIVTLLDFLSKAFDAIELQRRHRPDGSIMHAEVRIGDSMVMMGEPTGEFGPMLASLYLYVSDCDLFYQRALQAGGISVMEPTTMPSEGDRYGGVKDPSGNIWWIATHIEDVSSKEQAKA
jgi:PhnB protein